METQHKFRETKMCVFGHAYRCVVMLSDASTMRLKSQTVIEGA